MIRSSGECDPCGIKERQDTLTRRVTTLRRVSGSFKERQTTRRGIETLLVPYVSVPDKSATKSEATDAHTGHFAQGLWPSHCVPTKAVPKSSNTVTYLKLGAN